MSYQNDTLEAVYNEVKDIEARLMESGARLRPLGEAEATANALYEERKNSLLITLYADEARDGTKRTEAMRTAIYRSQFSQERLARSLAALNMKNEKEFASILQSLLMSKMARLRVLESERSFKN